MKKLFWIIFFFFASPAFGQESNFVTVKLPRGVQIQLPKGWWLINKEWKQLIQTSTEPLMDLTGLGPLEGDMVNFIRANSSPPLTYAAVSVNSSMPPSYRPQEVAKATKADLINLAKEMRENLEISLPLQGQKLLQFYGLRKDRISGHPALVSEYRRSGARGPVIVQINVIFTETQEVNVCLSYRESEVGIWKPVIEKIRQSIIVRMYTLPIHEQKMGVKLGDTFWGMCNLIKPLDWSQNSAAILQAASRADFPN